jgi:Tfp pilus assembly protein PilO
MRLSLDNISQRQQVVAIILVAGLVIAGLWYFLLYPQHKSRRALENRIAEMRDQLERSNALVGEAALRKRKNLILDKHKALTNEWANIMESIGSFSDASDAIADEVGHIDYKMALYEVQKRMNQKAAIAGISIPPELGMVETVESDEDARTLMMQLRALEKLVDVLLDIDISLLRSVEPLRPIVHGYGEAGQPYLEEYPVHVEFLGDLKNLYDLYHTMLESGHVLTMRRIRIKAASPINNDLLRVRAILSALVFLEDPSKIELKIKKSMAFVAPTGH